jgi:hypothetical protein
VTKQSELENRIKVKQRLAAKYERLALVAKSTPRRKTYLYHADVYRRQADHLAKLS